MEKQKMNFIFLIDCHGNQQKYLVTLQAISIVYKLNFNQTSIYLSECI